MARNKHISSDIWKTALNPSYPRWADLMDQNVVRSNSCVVRYRLDHIHMNNAVCFHFHFSHSTAEVS
jgi:hypothetical protein